MFKKEISNISPVNNTNFTKWLFVWNKTWPPSVEYIVEILMIPRTKIPLIEIKIEVPKSGWIITKLIGNKIMIIEKIIE